MTQLVNKTTQHNTVGKRTHRQDGVDKVTGSTRYAGDISMPGLLHARLVLSPFAHARIAKIDTAPALEVPGVKAVYTSETLYMANRNSASRSQAPLARDEALWCGHPVAIVLAETEGAAVDGAAAVDVDYEPLPAVLDPVAAMQPDAPHARTRNEGEGSVIAGGEAHAAVSKEEEEPAREDLLAGNPAPRSIITVKLGAKSDGTLVAMEARVIFDTGAYPGSAVILGGLMLGSMYRCPNVDFRCYEVLTNKVSVGAYRAPGSPQACFALESTVDELCQTLELDPLAFRLKNGFKEGDPTIDHRTWSRIGLLECLQKAQEHPLWAKRMEQKTAPGELKGWKIGTGLAAGVWPGGTEPAAAACRLEKDGTMTVIVGTVDLTGSDTSLALIAAEGLGISSSAVNVAHDNTDTMPYSGSTGGSKTTYSMGPAVLAAAQDARNQILSIASEMLEAAVGDLDIEGNKVVVRGTPSKSVALSEIASASMRFAGQYEPVYGRGRAAIKQSSPMFAVHVAKVAVDPETGEVRVLDYVAVQDVGFAINPAEVEGQIFGGVTQGIGWALFERLVYDENGQVLTASLMDYALPLSKDIPKITPVLDEIPSALGPFGAKGVGEPPVVPVGAAIANAVRDAVGTRVTQLPITPERLFEAMQ